MNAGPSSQTIIPLGGKLRTLHLHYKRWSRGPERNALIPAFGAVVASHPRKEQSSSFQLSLGEGPKLQKWDILNPVERFNVVSDSTETMIGVSSPYGIVPLLSTVVDDDDDDDDEPLTEFTLRALPRESEYITTQVELELPIDFLLSFHGLKEGRIPYLDLEMKQGTQFSHNAPLFHTLKVLHVSSISSSFFAGQTFHKLERYKEDCTCEGNIPEQVPLTEMPVCTRLVVRSCRLATLKLPQIRELSLLIDSEHGHIWEKHIMVNANLSGLRLLHLRCADGTWPTTTVIKILGSLPALETLITGGRDLTDPYVHFFEAFVPMNVPGPSVLNQSSWKSQISGVICPRLKSLQIENNCLTQQAELMPVFKDIVTLRALIGCPLKSFTFYFYEYPKGPQKWQLIGRDKSFVMKEVVPAEKFRLDI